MVRKDLPLGFLAAQVVHAAGESGPGSLPSGTHAIVLSAVDEQQLRRLHQELESAGVPHVLIEEPDAPWCGAATAIGLAPVADRSVVRRLLSSLPLLR